MDRPRGGATRPMEEYPIVVRRDGLRARPSHVLLMANRLWRVEWPGGLVSLYRADPRAFLRLGYEPNDRRWGRPSPEHTEKSASSPNGGSGPLSA